MELEAEIQELNDSITWWNNRYNALQRDYEDYKSRCEEAVEFIKENAWYMNKDNEEILDRISVEGLLKILEGGNNEKI